MLLFLFERLLRRSRNAKVLILCKNPLCSPETRQVQPLLPLPAPLFRRFFKQSARTQWSHKYDDTSRMPLTGWWKRPAVCSALCDSVSLSLLGRWNWAYLLLLFLFFTDMAFSATKYLCKKIPNEQENKIKTDIFSTLLHLLLRLLLSRCLSQVLIKDCGDALQTLCHKVRADCVNLNVLSSPDHTTPLLTWL